MSFVVTGNSFSGSTGADVGGYITSATFDIGTVVHDNTYSSGVAQPISVYVFGPDGQVVDGSDTATAFHLEYHSGAATVHGGAGSDAISYEDDGAGVTINLATGTATGAGGTATFTSIENAVGGGGNDTITGSAGANTLIGNDGDDTFTGGGGNDTIIGGAGSDTAVYTASITSAMLTDDGLGHFVVTTGGAEGADTLSGIEKITDGAGHHILLVGNGGYASIQAAIDAAVAGDLIRITAGTYNEHVDVNKNVTLEGANHGIAGNGVRGPESVITGGVKISAAGAIVDGVAISGSYDTAGTPDITSPSHIGLLIGSANVTVENSVLTGDALDLQPFGTFPAATGLNFAHNLVQSWNEAASLAPGGSGSITDNTFVNNTGNGVYTETTQFDISHNDFTGDGGSAFADVVAG